VNALEDPPMAAGRQGQLFAAGERGRPSPPTIRTAKYSSMTITTRLA